MNHNVLLEARNVCKKFANIRALSNVSFTIKEGEVYGIIGPNGAGKTTLFNCLTGFGAHDNGEFILSGKKLRKNSPEYNVSQGISRTFQNIRLFKKLSVLENILVGFHKDFSSLSLMESIFCKAKRKKIVDSSCDLMSYVGIDHSKKLMQAGNLSYGEQRKLEIARALATHPIIIALDEPAAGMNSVERETLRSLIRKIRDDGVAVIIIEHDIELVVNLCDRIAVLDFGEKIVEDTPEHVIADPKFISAYLGKDYEEPTGR